MVHSSFRSKMFARILTALLAAASITSVQADPTPIAPGPGDVFIEGQSCSIAWSVDPTGAWTTMNIHFDDWRQLQYAIATVDGTDPYQDHILVRLSQSMARFEESSANSTWTTRFIITDSTSDIVPAPQSTQPGGADIPWGTGTIVGTPASTSGSISSSTVSTAVSVATSAPTASMTGSSVSPVDTTTSTTTSNGADMHVPLGLLKQAVFAIGASIFGFASSVGPWGSSFITVAQPLCM
ncbi:hypothetical protein BKA83DRAFT_449421 [Pisolithus microcarpus]|nr:hypothetical protein BKA83DRAFT_449421 [Pisolithus microcarpus]